MLRELRPAGAAQRFGSAISAPARSTPPPGSPIDCELVTSETTIRVVLADDDARVRETLRDLLAEHPDIEVVSEAADGRAALERAGEFEPALVLMDVVMSGMGGIEATHLLRAALPSVKVIALSLHEDRQFVAAMRAAGASGYLLKDRVHEELARSLRGVAAGGNWWVSGTEAPG